MDGNRIQWVTVLGTFEGTETGGGGIDIMDIVGPFETLGEAKEYGRKTSGFYEAYVLQIPAKQ